jgi:hypothetical protein
MSLRKVLNQEEAVRLLRDAEASGLARAAWARQGVDPRSLNLWRVNLARRGAVPVAHGFVELVPRASAPPAAPAAARCPGVRVRVGALVVEVDAAFDPATLQRVLAVVATC